MSHGVNVEPEQRKVLLVALHAGDDELESLLHAAGWELQVAADVTAARYWTRRNPGCVGVIYLCDTLMASPDKAALEALLRESGEIEWIGLLEPQCVDRAREARFLPGFLYDYHTRPVDPSRFLHTLGHAAGMSKAKRAAQKTWQKAESASMLIGNSVQMRAVHADIAKIASVDASVMICGESGTGKELAAQLIHQHSQRAAQPFVAINCGALQPELIHSELFGHEKGAFTGAHRRRIGKLEHADRGTLFLDEIGDLPIDLQVNLLRFLQGSTFERLGGGESIRIDVRVIAASHVDLSDAMAAGRFREDLFYRLNVLRLVMPPLRERPDDVELLALHYFDRLAAERTGTVKGFCSTALAAMRKYSWPGNVRELINRVRRAIVMCDQRLISPRDLDLDSVDEEAKTTTITQARELAERSVIKDALRRTAHNVSEAARHLGVSRGTLYRLIEKHGLSRDFTKASPHVHSSRLNNR